jgi:hypothetical protein
MSLRIYNNLSRQTPLRWVPKPVRALLWVYYPTPPSAQDLAPAPLPCPAIFTKLQTAQALASIPPLASPRLTSCSPAWPASCIIYCHGWRREAAREKSAVLNNRRRDAIAAARVCRCNRPIRPASTDQTNRNMKLNLLRNSKSMLLVTGALLTLAQAQAAGPNPPPARLPNVTVRASDPVAVAGQSTAAFTIHRSGQETAELAVTYAISGTASNGVDYALIPDSATIPAGSASVDILIQPILVPGTTDNKTVVLTLQTNDAYRIPGRQAARVTIRPPSSEAPPPEVTLTSPTNGEVFLYPADITLDADATDASNSIASVSFYANDHFLGRVTNAPYQLVWSNAPLGHFALFARAVNEAGHSALSAPVHITVTHPAPSIALLSPTNGEVFPIHSDVTVSADTSGGTDTVGSVEIFGDGRLLATLTEAPYSVVWSNVPPGRHQATARATDAAGITASASARFTVSNAPPEVTLVNPTNGASFTAHSDITLEAQASDPDGSIARVSFWANQRFLGVVTNSPYSVVWSNAPAGRFSLRAAAADQFGRMAVSRPVMISVTSTNSTPITPGGVGHRPPRVR